MRMRPAYAGPQIQALLLPQCLCYVTGVGQSNAERQAAWRERRQQRIAELEVEVAKLKAENQSLRRGGKIRRVKCRAKGDRP